MPGFSPGLAQALAQQPQQEPDLERWRRLAEQMAGPAEMRSYDPSLRERMGNWVYDTLSGLGMPSQAEHTRGVVTGGADFVPGLGNAVTGEEAGRAFGEGNYGEGALLGAAALVPIPAAGKAVAKGTKKLAKVLAGETVKEGAAELGMGIRAYHGSPHSFEQFELSPRTIGTGEGAQSYGHGLYFAENESVGKGYRERTSASMPYLREGKPVAHGDLFQSMQDAAQAVPGTHPDQAHQITRQLTDALEEEGTAAKVAEAYQPPQGFEAQWNAALDAMKGVEWNKTPGHMYEVDIAAEPEQFLDWDKPLSQQSEAVRGVFEKHGISPTVTGDEAHRDLSNILKGESWDKAERDSSTANTLREAAIPGIKFLDQGSRNLPDVADLRGSVGMFEKALQKTPNDEMLQRYLADARAQLAEAEKGQTHNYVVFDDKLISILRKYGMGGMVGTAAGYEMAQQLMQQEGAQSPQPTNSRLAPLLMQQLPQTAPWSPNAT